MINNQPNDGKGGTYAALYLTPRSNELLYAWGRKVNILKYMFLDEKDPFHITICYSKIPLNFKSCGLLPPLPIKPLNFAIFGKDKNYLVLEVFSNFAQNRADFARMLGAQLDFPKYNPHVSLAKDSGITDITKLPPIDFRLYINKEVCYRINPKN